MIVYLHTVHFKIFELNFNRYKFSILHGTSTAKIKAREYRRVLYQSLAGCIEGLFRALLPPALAYE